MYAKSSHNAPKHLNSYDLNTNDVSDFALANYDYTLPSHCIASYPANPKESAKLLIYNRLDKSIIHSDFYHLFDFIPKDSTIILNDTRVIKARIYGTKQSGGKSEILFHYFLDLANTAMSATHTIAICQVRNSAPNGTIISLSNGYVAKVIDTFRQSYKQIIFYHHDVPMHQAQVFEMLESIGQIPLPPYIKRHVEAQDSAQYQSVFAKHNGSIAAPTASLHFSKSMLASLKAHFTLSYVTLHIGAGTFFGVESSDIRNHHIHSESLFISKQNANLIYNAKKILCIGTTAMRSVECLARANHNPSQDFSAQCNLFLHPGNKPIKTDYLLTNFHLPKSTLIMLVASMIGIKECQRVYQEALKNSYRFFSYGDGMLIL
ncbi:tRNA preQ1(34) S-adenosylmethionine ribosyltransferase-isomerase QueA [Helicobacter fennelliae]|uniref:tRNA preQ1(34) S-adenosylmethionine ribosyltransferase-isomerase QueA n=1 Tax=Helicobacter fennelliae TaxID=215 RepID=UPI000E00FD78|nr:tRNA preQ1(34) S-adenosylmethionine ribosyltransferase-isomerase QueA [Helicobacter fennelliae]STQ84539.1 S-adenosylmethionine:tRNA ribosyltransferase-isomerase [Helicobacter fennelliae]